MITWRKAGNKNWVDGKPALLVIKLLKQVVPLFLKRRFINE
jgi:hypothetical protein